MFIKGACLVEIFLSKFKYLFPKAEGGSKPEDEGDSEAEGEGKDDLSFFLMT